MGYHDDCLVLFLVDFTEQSHDFLSGFAVQVPCRFVGKEDFRAAHERPGDGHTLLLAAVGVINNLLINYMQKRRITAMYKSVGLSNRQNMKMTLIEGFSSGLIGAIIAIVVSYLEIQTIFLVAGPKISMSPHLELSTFLSAGLMGIGVTLLGSAVPILKSRRMKLVEEIKFE